MDRDVRSGWLRGVEALQYAVIGLWLGSYAVLAVAAAMIFGRLRELEVTTILGPLGDSEVIADKPSAIAGEVFRHVFMAVGKGQTALAVLLTGCVLVLWRIRPRPRWFHGLRALVLASVLAGFTLSLGAAAGTDASRQVMYDKAVSERLRAEARDRFDRYHRLSNASAQGVMIGLLVLLMVSPWVATYQQADGELASGREDDVSDG